MFVIHNTTDGVVVVWPLDHLKLAVVCEPCSLTMKVPVSDICSDIGRPGYVWQRVVNLVGGQAIMTPKMKGKTPTGGSTAYMVSPPVSRDHHQVGQCCNCIRHSTCSTFGPSNQACSCPNTGRMCTACVC